MEEGILTSDKRSEKKFDAQDRLDICHKCPIYDKNLDVCSSKLWYNPDDGSVSDIAIKGYTRGCGCLVSRKAQRENSHCHIGMW